MVQTECAPKACQNWRTTSNVFCFSLFPSAIIFRLTAGPVWLTSSRVTPVSLILQNNEP
ncbi:hypothetical protein BDV34DRAFT_203117 [Aspergillus parasiticus]|uniref:Uncharacterized protein n=1 Tax=Aspergillus parasiticus TaxID=5067 RepID=A0A5N6D7H6_ASPPA|nr:hypothetical protein BDV34DRAFT_203117 [Aspergillus parasiticus]